MVNSGDLDKSCSSFMTKCEKTLTKPALNSVYKSTQDFGRPIMALYYRGGPIHSLFGSMIQNSKNTQFATRVGYADSDSLVKLNNLFALGNHLKNQAN